MVGESLHASCLRIAQHLADGYARSGGAPCTFSIVGAGDLVRTPRQTINCTLYAYRFAQNQNLRVRAICGRVRAAKHRRRCSMPICC